MKEGGMQRKKREREGQKSDTEKNRKRLRPEWEKKKEWRERNNKRRVIFYLPQKKTNKYAR